MTLAARVSTRESVSDVLRKTGRPGVKLLTGTLTSNTRFPYVGLARRIILHLKVKAPWRVSRWFGLNDLLRWWVGHALRVFDGAGRGDVRAPTRHSLSRVSSSRPMPDRGRTCGARAWGNQRQQRPPADVPACDSRAWGNLGRGDVSGLRRPYGAARVRVETVSEGILRPARMRRGWQFVFHQPYNMCVPRPHPQRGHRTGMRTLRNGRPRTPTRRGGRFEGRMPSFPRRLVRARP